MHIFTMDDDNSRFRIIIVSSPKAARRSSSAAEPEYLTVLASHFSAKKIRTEALFAKSTLPD
jgi:hypothetical protein